MIKSLILMLQFFTRIPIPIALPANQQAFRNGVVFIPAVGLVIGSILYALYWVLVPKVPIMAIAIVIILLEIILTGGLHLDGLADSFDGIYSSRKKDRILEIMKDSHIGTYGVLALIMTIFTKFVLLINIDKSILGYVILTMPIISRCGVVILAYKFPYARENGLGNWLIGNVAIHHVISVMAITFAMVGLAGVSSKCDLYLWSYVVLIAVLFAVVYGQHTKKHIDGITGDTLGAYIELSEVVQLLFWVIALSFS